MSGPDGSFVSREVQIGLDRDLLPGLRRRAIARLQHLSRGHGGRTGGGSVLAGWAALKPGSAIPIARPTSFVNVAIGAAVVAVLVAWWMCCSRRARSINWAVMCKLRLAPHAA